MLYDRLRAIACRYWAVPPPVLDGMIERREIAVRDVTELVKMLAHDPLVGFWIGSYLVPEVEQRRVEMQRRQNNINGFGLMLNTFTPQARNPEEARFLELLKLQSAEAGRAAAAEK